MDQLGRRRMAWLLGALAILAIVTLMLFPVVTPASADHASRTSDQPRAPERRPVRERRDALDVRGAAQRSGLPADAGVRLATPVRGLSRGRYEVKPLGRRFAIDLRGGVSEATLFPGGAAEPAAQRHRVLSGRVIDQSGRGLAGAIVVADTRLASWADTLTVAAAARSEPDGSFTLSAPTGALQVVAMDSERGWSRVSAVAAGDEAVALELIIAAPSSLDGRVTRNGRPEDATVRATDEANPKFELRADTASDGTYSFSLLPPGTYQISAGSRQDVGGGVSAEDHKRLVLEPGQRGALEFELREGVLLAVEPRLAVSAQLQTLEYLLFEGDRAPPTWEEASAIAAHLPEAKRREVLYGGAHAIVVHQFHDLEAERYVLCVQATFAGGRKWFASQLVDLRASAAVVELPLELGR